MLVNFISINGTTGNIYKNTANGYITANFLDFSNVAPNDIQGNYYLESIYKLCKNTARIRNMSDSRKFNQITRFAERLYEEVYRTTGTFFKGDFVDVNNIPTADSTVDTKPQIDFKQHLTNLINFFSEFEFEPNFRFVNTMARIASTGNEKSVKDYVFNYFNLSDNVYKDSIKEKMKSEEFNIIIRALKESNPKEQINKHLKIYYGSQGTGKTTQAMKEADNRCIVCHSAMLPSDLLEDFDFDNGNATFKTSMLQKAIETGKKIVLDECNLLPFESVRFLQSIVDGKESFIYKGKTIKIHPDFCIIGTMNLTVNGGTFALPEPLIDRAYELKQFKLTAENLMAALA